MSYSVDKIQATVQERNINALVHFTREVNLISIFENGLHSVESARKNNISISITDEQRWDGHLDAISTSISFPNYRIFFPKRNSISGEWAVICLSADVLWENSCEFFKHNAASNRMKSSTPLSKISDFESMFEQQTLNSRGQQIDRNNLSVPYYMTTDPEAEVLVSNTIDTKYITDICFSSELEQQKYDNKIKNIRPPDPRKIECL